jgi:hypothetical protein
MALYPQFPISGKVKSTEITHWSAPQSLAIEWAQHRGVKKVPASHAESTLKAQNFLQGHFGCGTIDAVDGCSGVGR